LIGGGGWVTLLNPLLNPAIALGLCIFQGDLSPFQYYLVPFAGMLCAVVFYEFIFVKT